MKRAFTLVELLTVMMILFIIAAALTHSVTQSRSQAHLAKAKTEMASIVAEVRAARDVDAAIARYAKGMVKDPWGRPYRVKVRRITRPGAGLDGSRSAVWYPNAYSPRGGGG